MLYLFEEVVPPSFRDHRELQAWATKFAWAVQEAARRAQNCMAPGYCPAVPVPAPASSFQRGSAYSGLPLHLSEVEGILTYLQRYVDEMLYAAVKPLAMRQTQVCSFSVPRWDCERQAVVDARVYLLRKVCLLAGIPLPLDLV